MANNKNVELNEVESEQTELTEKVEVKNAEPSKNIVVPTKKSAKEDKTSKKKEKKPSKVGKMLKETGSELKKVTWPKIPTVVKQTGVVIVVVVLFTAILFGIDRLLSLLFDLLLSKI